MKKLMPVIYLAVYVCILFAITRTYRKIKKHPEVYNNMDRIYAYDPRFKYAKRYELDEVVRETDQGTILAGMIAVLLAILNSVIYYFVRRCYFPMGAQHLDSEAGNAMFLALISGYYFLLVVITLFDYSESGLLQAIAVGPSMLGRKGKFERSKTMRTHLRIIGILFAVLFPIYFFCTFNYIYTTETTIVHNPFFSLHEDVYQMNECQEMTLQYRKQGKKERDRYIDTQLSIVGKNEKRLELGNASEEIFKWYIN